MSETVKLIASDGQEVAELSLIEYFRNRVASVGGNPAVGDLVLVGKEFLLGPGGQDTDTEFDPSLARHSVVDRNTEVGRLMYRVMSVEGMVLHVAVFPVPEDSR